MKRRRSEAEDARILAELAREAAELPVPPLDWAHLEDQLFAHIEGKRPRLSKLPALSATGTHRARWPWLGALAIAATVLLAWWTQKSSQPVAAPSVASRVVPLLHDGAGATVGTPLRVGDIVDSAGDRFRYELPGVVSLMLDPGSEMVVLAHHAPNGDPGSLTIELLRGAIHAEVIHREHGEAFGVEVGSTRVAVHGTAFSVTREGDRALVDVTHGSVAVGPVGHRGTTQGWLVVGPDRASFSLDGAKDVRWLHTDPLVGQPNGAVGAPSASSADSPRGVGPVDSEPPPAHAQATTTGKAARSLPLREQPSRAATASESPAPVPLEKQSPEAIERAQTALILQKLGACYNKQAASLGMRFSVDTTLTLSLYPNGTVRQGLFAPPLSPTLMRCASDAINEAHFAPRDPPTELRLPVHLSQAGD